jgi:hypothetical protein
MQTRAINPATARQKLLSCSPARKTKAAELLTRPQDKSF